MPYTIWCHAQKWKQKKTGEEVEYLEWCLEQWCLTSQVTVAHDETSFPGSGWASSRWWQVLNEFLVLPCLYVQILLYLVNYLSQPTIFLYFSTLLIVSPIPLWVEWLSSCVELSYVKTWQKIKFLNTNSLFSGSVFFKNKQTNKTLHPRQACSCVLMCSSCSHNEKEMPRNQVRLDGFHSHRPVVCHLCESTALIPFQFHTSDLTMPFKFQTTVIYYLAWNPKSYSAFSLPNVHTHLQGSTNRILLP